jgi:hypothetical protein
MRAGVYTLETQCAPPLLRRGVQYNPKPRLCTSHAPHLIAVLRVSLSTCSQQLNRRDPSGGRSPRHLVQAQPHHLLDDHDLVYSTTQSPPQTATLPDLPLTPVQPLASPRRSTSPSEPVLQSKRFEFQRRGQRAGDVGWGCARPNPAETQQNGRVDGHALVSSDLHKKHQFMRLSGDPSFDKRAGRMVLTAGSLRKPAAMTRPVGASPRGTK